MDLPDLLEIRRINTLPFADPIGVIRKWGDKELVIVAGSWLERERRRRAFNRWWRHEDKVLKV